MKGPWAVIRFCCTSGQCIGPHPHGRRQRVMQMDGLTKEKAEQVAKNWRNYDAKAVEVKEGQP